VSAGIERYRDYHLNVSMRTSRNRLDSKPCSAVLPQPWRFSGRQGHRSQYHIDAIGPGRVGARVVHALYAWIKGSCQKHYAQVARGDCVMDEPRTPVSSTDQTPQPDTNSLLESTLQKHRFPLTRRASTRSTTSSVVRREMHVPADNASGTWQLSLIVLIDSFVR